VLPWRDVQPLGVKLLVERLVVGGEPGQLGGVRGGVRVGALAPLEAGAGADVRVPAGGPAPLGPFAGSQVSARGSKGSPTAAQYAAIVAAGRATRSSESMTTEASPPASRTAACTSHSLSSPIASTVMPGYSA
jgi:hypothetical protein